jgi:hypothetical protein
MLRHAAVFLLLAGCATCGPGEQPTPLQLQLPEAAAPLPLFAGARHALDVTVLGGAAPVTFLLEGADGITLSEAALPGSPLRYRLSLEVSAQAAPGARQATLRATDAAGTAAQAALPLQVRAAPAPAAAAVPVRVAWDAPFYADGAEARLQVDFGQRAAPAALPDAVIASADSRDVERVALVRAEGNTFLSAPLKLKATLQPVQVLDGTLGLPAGGAVVGFVAFDRADPSLSELGADVAHALAFLEASPGNAVEVGVEPALAALEPDGGVGTLVGEGGRPLQFATGQLVLQHADAQGLQAFLAHAGGRLVQTLEGEEGAWFSLVEVDPSAVSAERLEAVRAALGEHGMLRADAPPTLGTLGLALAYRAQGFDVSLNPRLVPDAAPGLSAGEATASGEAMSMKGAAGAAAPCIPGTDAGACALSVPALWSYLALQDVDARTIPVALVDDGFDYNPDYARLPDGGVPVECDVSGLSPRCAPAAAQRAPALRTSGGSFMWHGMGVLGAATAALDNGYGVAGTGGQVAQAQLYNVTGGTYAWALGQAIRRAVDNGAAVINVSSGYPCRVSSVLGPTFNVCSVTGRAELCATVSAAAAAAAAAVCASPAAAIPVVGAVLCSAAVSTAITASAACNTSLLLGDLRGPIHAAVRYAQRSGVPVVASAGNRVSPAAWPPEVAALLNTSDLDVDHWATVPATLPGVIAVGAVGTGLGNSQLYGERVTTWAPDFTRFMAPESLDPFSPDVLQDFSGTSAAAPFVTGVVAAMQAVNPTLDPARATPLQRATAVQRITDILRGPQGSLDNAQLVSLGYPDEPVQRPRLIHPLGAVLAAADGHLPVPLDPTLNFSEPLAPDDSPAAGRPLPLDTSVSGTVLRLSSTQPQDEDWYAVQLPPAPDRAFGVDVELTWAGDEPPTLLNAAPLLPWTASPPVTAADGTHTRTFHNVAAAGSAFAFAVTALTGQDTSYRARVPTPAAPLEPTLSLTEPVVPSGGTLCAGSVRFIAEGVYPGSTLSVPDSNGWTWTLNGVTAGGTLRATYLTLPVGTANVTVSRFGAVLSRAYTVVDCTARTDITSPSANISQYFTGTDASGPYLTLALSGRARDPQTNAQLNAGNFTFEWTTSRGDVQPGAPSTGPQLLATGTAATVRLYVPAADTQAQHVITLTLKDLSGNTLSTDSVVVTVLNVI